MRLTKHARVSREFFTTVMSFSRKQEIVSFAIQASVEITGWSLHQHSTGDK